MFNLILFEPEIPANTGNIIRLCANTGSTLHLIEPLGFTLADRQLKRAGLDYHEYATLKVYPDLATCLAQFSHQRIFALSTKAQRPYHEITFKPGDSFLLGPETRGLPESIRQQFLTLRLPMVHNSRSLNLANSAAIMLYEAWRQQSFAHAV